MSVAQSTNFLGHLSTLQLHVGVWHFFIFLSLDCWNMYFFSICVKYVFDICVKYVVDICLKYVFDICVWQNWAERDPLLYDLKHRRSSLLWQVFMKIHWSLNKFWSSWRILCKAFQLHRRKTDKVFSLGMEGKIQLKWWIIWAALSPFLGGETSPNSSKSSFKNTFFMELSVLSPLASIDFLTFEDMHACNNLVSITSIENMIFFLFKNSLYVTDYINSI